MKKLLQSLFVLMFVAISAMAQERTISGTVTGQDDGKPLPGVSVRVKGSTTATSSRSDGRYSISVPSTAKELVFSYVGYADQSRAIGTSNTINVSLITSSKELGEVVVVAYGTQKKTSFTGSLSTISSSTLTRGPVADFTKALDGVASGVQITSGGGQPGSTSTIRIRGIGSINASSDPLIVVDGAPYNGDLASIAPSDIENISVLKDASATALYGSRGANGVLVVTTKRGKIGDPKLNVSLRTGIVKRSMKDYATIPDEKTYYELMWEAYRNQLVNAGGQSVATAGQNASKNLVSRLGGYNSFDVANNALVDPVTGQLNPNAHLKYHDNFNDAITQTGIRQDYNMNVSGATDKSDYYISLGYLDDKGIVKYTGYNRYTARVNVNAQATPWLKTGLNVSGAYAKQTNTTGDNSTATLNPFYTNRLLAPIYPVYVRDANNNFIPDIQVGGNLLDYGKRSGDGISMGDRPFAPQSNTLGTLMLDKNYSNIVTGMAVGYVEAKFLKDFTFRTTMNAQYNNQYETNYNNIYYGQFGPPTSGAGSKSSDNVFSYTFNQLLTWAKKFDKHSLDVLVGHENYNYTDKNLSANRTTFGAPGIDDLNIASVAGGSGSYTNTSRIESFLSRVNYDYDNKYFLSGSFRRDGSSRFYKDVRWGNFWSAGGAWRLTQEDFLKDVSWLNELKAKVSYGEQGNESLLSRDGTTPLYYGWQGLYDLGVSNGATNGATVYTLQNLSLQWEKSKNLNIGLEFGLFQNRVSGSLEYYDRKSDNLLFQRPLPASFGLTYRFDNIGAMKNYGMELNLSGKAIQSTDFQWNVDLNLTTLKNKVTKLPPGQDKIIVGNKQLMVGKSAYEFFLVESAGVDPSNGDELYYKTNADGSRSKTNIYNDAVNGGKIYSGSSIPNLFGGITNSFSYKGFDFSFLTSFAIGGKFYDATYATLMGTGTFGQNWSPDMINRWTPANPNSDIPRLQVGNVNIGRPSTRFLISASYLNIKNATFGYTIPKSSLSVLGISSLRFYVSGDNLHLFSKRQGMDPQTSFNGNAQYTYVPVRTVSLGLNVGF